MKRSELRKKIAEELIPDGEIWYEGRPDDWTYQEAMAEEIIKFVETAGMLPPFNIHDFYTDGDNADEKSIVYRTWEEE